MSQQERNWYLTAVAMSDVTALTAHIVWPQPGLDDYCCSNIRTRCHSTIVLVDA